MLKHENIIGITHSSTNRKSRVFKNEENIKQGVNRCSTSLLK